MSDSLTWLEFLSQAKEFLAMSLDLNDSWQLIEKVSIYAPDTIDSISSILYLIGQSRAQFFSEIHSKSQMCE